jgi:hypothetical protein
MVGHAMTVLVEGDQPRPRGEPFGKGGEDTGPAE